MHRPVLAVQRRLEPVLQCLHQRPQQRLQLRGVGGPGPYVYDGGSERDTHGRKHSPVPHSSPSECAAYFDVARDHSLLLPLRVVQ
jgi:hypothetical protein